MGFTAKHDNLLIAREGEIMRGQAPENIALFGNTQKLYNEKA